MHELNLPMRASDAHFSGKNGNRRIVLAFA
jgi:hypothetical protein